MELTFASASRQLWGGARYLDGDDGNVILPNRPQQPRQRLSYQDLHLASGFAFQTFIRKNRAHVEPLEVPTVLPRAIAVIVGRVSI